ncbi:hypothetical protein Bca52824_008403 [Brassica carinata]|uniref:Uncharacterized protein n=1 Tax=Brassica carinata TaxID=52824 RepID=A0A8X8B833_BRACI|nr:hypothetical protein Bca52824_008403 [Brassica carinata]
MFAPPSAAASSDIHPPCFPASEQPTDKPLVSESTTSQLVFPNEFPYEFDSSAFTSPEAEDDETNDADEVDFLAGLTRRLALFTQRLPPPPPIVTDKAEANSTESTRIGLGSCITSGNKSPDGPFSQAPSPPETPVRKVANFGAKPNSFTPFPQNAAFYDYRYYYYWLQQPQAALVTCHYPVGGVFAAPTAVKQPSAGTGVFFPQNCTNPSRSRKKGGKCVKFPTKVVQRQHPKGEKFHGRCESRAQAHLSAGCSKLDRGTKSSVTGGCLKEEPHLPQEWMY